jgi:hypothetical protein
MIKLFLFLCTALGSIQDCSKGGSVLKLTTLDLVPAVPVIGQPVVMTVQFNNPGKVITSGTATTAIKYSFIPIAPTVEDLCVATPCPLTIGFNDRSTNSTWPDVKGNLETTITWKGSDGSELLCIKVSIKKNKFRLRGKNSSGLTLFKDNGTGICPLDSILGKELVVYRQWSKSKRTNSSKTPEDL